MKQIFIVYSFSLVLLSCNQKPRVIKPMAIDSVGITKEFEVFMKGKEYWKVPTQTVFIAVDSFDNSYILEQRPLTDVVDGNVTYKVAKMAYRYHYYTSKKYAVLEYTLDTIR